MAVVIDQERRMTLGLAERQGDLLDDVTRFCDETLASSSVYSLLDRERDALFPDEFFADLFSDRGRRSARPDRVFEVALEAARSAGLVGRRRVMDSTRLYDAVANMDTITLIRSAVRSLLAVAGDGLEAELRAVLASGDDYASSAKPQIDWNDPAARDELIDSRAKDAFACLALLDGRELDPAVDQAARLVAIVVGS